MSLLLQDPAIQMFNSTAKPPLVAWDDLSDCVTLDAAIVKVGEQYEFQFHPYFLWMNSSAVGRAQFLQSQLPFRYAVEAFSQSLAAVLAQVSTLESRLGLMENLSEEHGRGNPLRSHKATFRQYLQSLGATAPILESPITVPVLAFNQSVRNFCLTHSPEAGAAMLGMIEYLYIGISASISKTIHDRHWVIAGSQSHYAAHEVLDVDHARDLFQLAHPGWDHPRSKVQLTEAMTLGAQYFWDLYEGLHPNV